MRSENPPLRQSLADFIIEFSGFSTEASTSFFRIESFNMPSFVFVKGTEAKELQIKFMFVSHIDLSSSQINNKHLQLLEKTSRLLKT